MKNQVYTPESYGQKNAVLPNSPILSGPLKFGATDAQSQGVNFLQQNAKAQNFINTHHKGGSGNKINANCGKNAAPAGTHKTVSMPSSLVPDSLMGPQNAGTAVTSLTKTAQLAQVQGCGDSAVNQPISGGKSKRRRRRSKSNRKKRTKRTKRTKGRRRRSTKRTKSRRRRTRR